MNKIFQLDINLGIGDHLIIRFFLDRIKDQYSSIQITHSRPGMTKWRNNDPAYWKFIFDLGDIVFGEKPYKLIKQHIHFPFWPSERFISLGIKPIRPIIPGLIVNHNFTDVINGEYIILTTKVREITKNTFQSFMKEASPILKELEKKYKIVLMGEREVEKSAEYLIGNNQDIIFSAYKTFRELLPNSIDLTVPALGIIAPDIKKLQHDCYLMSKAKAVLALGVGGNTWISAVAAPYTLCLRGDDYKTTDLFVDTIPELYITRSVKELCKKMKALL